MARVYIGVGSNKGDRKRHIIRALKHLDLNAPITRISAFFSSIPAENARGGTFLNGVVECTTFLSPRGLLSFLLDIEKAEGRSFPHGRGEPREVDLDIIFYGREKIESRDLVIPHPRYRFRDFVIIPLAEIAPLLTDPVSGVRISEIRKGIDKNENS